MKVDRRYEIKFLVPPQMRYSIHSLILDHPACFRRSYPTRSVHTLYFDTLSLKSRGDSLAGYSVREKLRLRWYDTDLPNSSALMQIKSKEGRVSIKEEESICFEKQHLRGCRYKFVSTLRRLVPPRLRLYMNLYPLMVLSTEYKRDYFESADGKIRLTIDNKIRIYDQSNRPSLNFNSSSDVSDLIILEIKFKDEHLKEGKTTASWFPFDIVRNSKYMIGLSRLK